MSEEIFIKVALTKKEKMNLLLFDLLPERILKREIVYKYKQDKSINVKEDDEFDPITLNDVEADKFEMPFFDNIEKESDSNF